MSFLRDEMRRRGLAVVLYLGQCPTMGTGLAALSRERHPVVIGK